MSNGENKILELISSVMGFSSSDRSSLLISVLTLFFLFTLFKVIIFILNLFLLSLFSESLRRKIAVQSALYCINSKIGSISRANLFHIALQESSIISKLARDVIDLTTNSMVLLSIVAVLVTVNINMALVFLIVGIIIYLIYHFILKNYSVALGEKRIKYANRITSHVKQVIDGAIDLFTLKSDEFPRKYISEAFVGYGFLIGQVNNLRRSPVKIIELVIVLLFVVVLIANINQIGMGNSDLIGTIGVYFVGLLRLGSVLAVVYALILSIFNKLPSLNKVFSTSLSNFNEQLMIQRIFSKSVKKIVIHKCAGARPEGKRILIENQEIRKGRLHAIIGESGIGKTTLCYMLCGLLNAEQFKVEVDGEMIFDQNQFLQKVNVVYVPQSPVFFETGLKENIDIGRMNNYPNLEDLLEEVGLLEWVNSFARKENEIIGDKGLQPSGGQLKRLALVRALAASPQVLIVDEPTSGLDKASEYVILGLLEKLSKNLLVIVVTHSEIIQNDAHSIQIT